MNQYSPHTDKIHKQRLSTRLFERLLFPSRNLSSKEKQRLAHELAGKTILITGASYGIGEQLAYLLASLGTANNMPISLILVGRTTEKLEQVQAHIHKTGASVSIYPIDLRDDKSLKRFMHFLHMLSVDIFINNAGKSIMRSVMDSLDRGHDYERTISLNYLAPVKLCLGLIPQLGINQGQIINVSALNVLLPPMPKWSAYQASKSAFDQWFRSVAPELYAQKITTSTLYLPLVRTRMIAPTAIYQSAPTMTTEQVAAVIGRLIIHKKSSFKPWWLYPIEILALLFKRPLEFCVRSYYRHQSR
ncbi:MAG: SDR family NAD(P)-dependent oxidoreductase [Psychrobacter sp.]|uniref:SDR family NAD(P)-dependent oxidoreductase n=1 Tax=unclassified Psychrobacter TaxID=196806 RepID=UPI001787C4F8|nr:MULTISPECIES: SDR family NAD(P)-dependent oxidoreductase [unclassified Psychrobacter]MBE0442988.1 SDR family NAD(P)-dependent oxidoreductase [Psychrobacter sp. FME13]